jgi:SAM-dependent methyltransferase
VVLLGPLYHLPEREQRLRVLREAHRVLRPRGALFATAISRFVSLHEAMFDGFLADPAFHEILKRDLERGEHVNPSKNPDWFTNGYFHRPDELRDELDEAGFETCALVGVEGAAKFMPDLEEWLADPPRRKTLLNLLRQVEAEPSMLGVSSHLHAVATRAGTKNPESD